MKKQKKIIIILIIIFGSIGLYWFANMLAPGSDPYAEVYVINASEEKVTEAIKLFKSQHPEFNVPNVTIENKGSFSLCESEGRKENENRYFNYFYYKTENQILFTWTRKSFENNKTDLAFVSVNNGLDIGHWKDVNSDFGYSENKDAKEKFENLILAPIKSYLNLNKE